jgi:hypothetical protein
MLTYNNQYDIVITNFRMFESIPAQSSLPYCTLTNDLFNFDDIVYNGKNPLPYQYIVDYFKITLFRFPEQLKAKEDWIMWIALYKNNCSTFLLINP